MIDRYTTNLRQWLKNLFEEKKETFTTTKRCCLIISNNTIALVFADTYGGRLHPLASAIEKFSDQKSLQTLLSELTKKYGIHKIPTTLLLSQDQYQLFLIESLPVTPDELQEALVWRVRSLITFPIEEAIVDYFTLPAKRNAPDNPMIAAVIARTSQLNQIINTIKKAGLSMTTIGIPELALKQLTDIYEDDEKSTAFIYFYNESAILNISQKRTLYFTRRLVWPTTITTDTKAVEQFNLDLMRYFDYFQSQWRIPAPTRVFVASEQQKIEEIIQALSHFTMLTLEPYVLKTSLFADPKTVITDSTLLLPIANLLGELSDESPPAS